jgi:oligosaccharide repeat unit polymerase
MTPAALRGTDSAPPPAAPVLPPTTGLSVRRAADLWWLHPSVMMLLGVLPMYLAISRFDFSRTVPLAYVPGPTYWAGVVLLLAVVVGIQWALAPRQLGPARVPPQISLGATLALLVPALVAYLLWFGPLLAQPQLLLEVAQGRRQHVRDEISTIPGLTTFTQFGLPYMVAYAIRTGAGMQRVHRVEHLGALLLVLLAVFRAFAWAERLAVLEMLVCFTITRLAYLPIASARGWRLASVLPALAPLLLYGVFTTSEYFRTWEYYKDRYDSVWVFTLDRLLSYYATAVNNGVGMLEETEGWPFFSGSILFESFWLAAPGLMGQLEAPLAPNLRVMEQAFLERYANPEFNSPTAYFRIVLELGWVGATLMFIGLGYLIGRAYAGLRRGHVFGLLCYGVFVLHIAESLRFGYLGETRFVPSALGLILIALDIQRQRRRAQGSAG